MCLLVIEMCAHAKHKNELYLSFVPNDWNLKDDESIMTLPAVIDTTWKYNRQSIGKN